MKKIVLNGKKMIDTNSFYQEVQEKLTRDLPFKMGNNLDALYDILEGGYGVFDYHEKIIIQWISFSFAKENIKDFIDEILIIFKQCNHIKLERIDKND